MATVRSATKSSKWHPIKFLLPMNFHSIPLLRSRSRCPTLTPSPSTPSTSSIPSTPSDKEEEFRQIFRYFDRNNDGKISAEQLRAHFVSTGEAMSYEEAESLVREFDNDGDNLLEIKDFVRLMGGENEEEEELRKVFEEFEVEKGCGIITPRGLQQVFNRLGNAKSYEECETMVRAYDLDGNGVLDFLEFQKMMA